MRYRRLIAATFTLLAAACATTSEPGLREQLDERTGVTVTSLRAPLEFFAAQPQRGLQAASFAYLGPIEINRMGSRETFLWLSVLHGADARGRSSEELPSDLPLRITAGGTTFAPVYVSAEARRVGLGHRVYERPARWAEEAFYAITPREIAQIAAASALILEIGAESEAAQRYELWNTDLDGLRAFAERMSAANP